MVQQIQTMDEFYDPYEDDDDPFAIFYAPSYYTSDEQLVLIACLMLLEQRFRLMRSMTPQGVVDEIDSIMDSLESELTSTAISQIHSTVYESFVDELMKYGIPQDRLSQDTSLDAVIEESIKNLCNQLRSEIKTKALLFKDYLMKDDFDILPNFKRAVQRLKDAVGNNLLWSKELSKRKVYEFVYGKDKLYRWYTVNDDKVCNWCRIQEKLPPRTIKEMPLDHPHGRCVIDPIDYTYSDEYMIMLARGEYADAIELYTPTKDKRWK